MRAVVIWAGSKEFAAKSIGDVQVPTPAVGVIVGEEVDNNDDDDDNAIGPALLPTNNCSQW